MNEVSESAKPTALAEKVKSWLESEGYPLEFETARVFQEQGFDALQGHYVMDEIKGQPREIDVLANITIHPREDQFFRASQVIECKWSRDKPWVVFTSGRSIMAESACIAQTVGSTLGEAAMYCAAGNADLYQLDTFRAPLRGGFAGRRAFEKEGDDRQDQFYKAMQGVVSASVAEARRYNKPNATTPVPDSGLIVFPVIVIDGNLFEAYYEPGVGGVVLSEVDKVRVFWRGARTNRRVITPVEIVTAKAVSEFARIRAGDMEALLKEVTQTVLRIQTAYKERNFDRLDIKSAPRGFVGLPPLLAEL